jgi:hypothetical protein
MQLALSRESQATLNAAQREYGVIDHLDIKQTGISSSVQLPFQHFGKSVNRCQESVDSLEVARNAFVANDRLDSVDRPLVRRRYPASDVITVQLREIEVAIVNSRHEMRRRARRHARTKLPVIEYDDLVSILGQAIRDREPRHARANHARISVEIIFQWLVRSSLT